MILPLILLFVWCYERMVYYGHTNPDNMEDTDQLRCTNKYPFGRTLKCSNTRIWNEISSSPLCFRTYLCGLVYHLNVKHHGYLSEESKVYSRTTTQAQLRRQEKPFDLQDGSIHSIACICDCLAVCMTGDHLPPSNPSSVDPQSEQDCQLNPNKV